MIARLALATALLAVPLAIPLPFPLPGTGSEVAFVSAAHAEDFTLSFPHRFGVAGAKRRAAAQIVVLQRQFPGASTVSWAGNTANVRVNAMGETATAQIYVRKTSVVIHVSLSMALAAFSGTVQEFVTRNAQEALRT